MEKVNDLTREFKRKGLTKLKINLEDSLEKNIDRIVSFISKDLNCVENMDNLESYFSFKNFGVEIEECDLKKSNSLCGNFLSKTDRTTFHKAYLVILNCNDYCFDAYTIASAKMSSRARNHMWKLKGSAEYNDRIVDMHYLYGYFKMLDIVIEELYEKKDYFTSDSFKDVSYFSNKYDEKDFSKLFNLEEMKYKYKAIKIDTYMQEMIIDCILLMQNESYNIELMEKYNKDSRSEVARAFETKLNIPEKVQAVMNNNKFLEDFSFVELDQDVDLKKFNQIETEYIKIRKLFSHMNMEKAEFRIRKLGKHRALGIYFYTLKCLCIDLTSPSSYIHEYGHHIDYCYEKRQLSLQLDFYPIIIEYQKAYNNWLAGKEGSTVDYLKRKIDYYFTPTEIFARCLEIYLVNKGLETSFLKDKKDMTMENGGYPKISKSFLKIINNYFDTKLKIDIDNWKKEIEKDEAVQEVIQEVKSQIVEIEDFKYSLTEQLGFVI